MNEKKLNKPEFDFNQLKADVIAQVKAGQPLTGKGGVLTPLLKNILEAALEGEMDAHLSECHTEGQSNRRNGKLKKTVKTGSESFELSTPRDREGQFEPEVVKKRQTVLNESLDNKVLALYGMGMSYEAIAEHLSDMYDLDISSAKISLVTDRLLPIITEWRNRSLDAVYPVIFMDAMHFKVQPVQNWALIAAQLQIFFQGRLVLELR